MNKRDPPLRTDEEAWKNEALSTEALVCRTVRYTAELAGPPKAVTDP